jgi:hypothetical protein
MVPGHSASKEEWNYFPPVVIFKKNFLVSVEEYRHCHVFVFDPPRREPA